MAKSIFGDIRKFAVINTTDYKGAYVMRIA